MTKKGYSLHDSLYYWMRKMSDAMLIRLQGKLQESGVTGPQWLILGSLYRGDATTPAELAKFIGVDGGSVTRLLDRLEEKGLVFRTRSDDDRRSVAISLTKTGLALMPTLVRISQENNTHFMKGLAAEDIRQVKTTIQRMLEQQDNDREEER